MCRSTHAGYNKIRFPFFYFSIITMILNDLVKINKQEKHKTAQV